VSINWCRILGHRWVTRDTIVLVGPDAGDTICLECGTACWAGVR